MIRNKVSKVVSVIEAINKVKTGEHIYIHSVASFPRILVNQLAKRARDDVPFTDITLYHLHVEGEDPTEDPDLNHNFKTVHYFIGKNARKAVAEGRGSYVPVFLSEIPKLIRQGIPHQLDWAFLNVSLPDKHGYCSLGPEVCAALPAAQSAKRVIAQSKLNPNVPRTHGNSFIHIDSFDYVVNVNKDDPFAKLPEMHDPPITELESTIGQNIANLVPDGATLQVGIGAIPNAVLKCLHNHKNLGIHSEMISNGVMDLIKSGAVTNTYKKFLKDRTLTSFLVGTQSLYDYVNDNPSVFMEEASITNDPVIISQNNNVMAINSAVQIDLTGQVCADSVGSRMISGIGGQLDFERGAALSQGGFPIIVLPSMSIKNNSSSIVNFLNPGAGITTSRYHVHWVVTEYGAVNLFGKTLKERAKLLISIAHPKFRETLAKAAFDRYRMHIHY